MSFVATRWRDKILERYYLGDNDRGPDNCEAPCDYVQSMRSMIIEFST